MINRTNYDTWQGHKQYNYSASNIQFVSTLFLDGNIKFCFLLIHILFTIQKQKKNYLFFKIFLNKINNQALKVVAENCYHLAFKLKLNKFIYIFI
jgi:hypothetical protein